MATPDRLTNGSTNGHAEPPTLMTNAEFSELKADVMRLVSNEFLLTRDALNRALFDPRRDVYAECGYPRSPTLEAFLELYERLEYAKTCVELYPSECWQVQPTVFEEEEGDTITPFEEAWDNLGRDIRGEASWYGEEADNPVWHYLQRVDKESGLGRYGVLLIGIDDGKSLQEPVDGIDDMGYGKPGKGEEGPDRKPFGLGMGDVHMPLFGGQGTERQYWDYYGYAPDAGDGSRETDGKKQPGKQEGSPGGTKRRKVTFLRTFPEHLAPVSSYETRNCPRYGQPYQYQLHMHDPRSNVGGGMAAAIQATKVVHWSRVIHVADKHFQAPYNEWLARPRLQVVFNSLQDLLKIKGSAAEGFWQACFSILAFESHPSLGADAQINVTELRNQFEQLFGGLKRWVGSAAGTFKTLPPQVTDPTGHMQVVIKAICNALRCPVRIFEGSERGELASSQDDAAWNDRVKERQKNYVTPCIIMPFVDRLIAMGVLPEPAKPKKVARKNPKIKLEAPAGGMGAPPGGGASPKPGGFKAKQDPTAPDPEEPTGNAFPFKKKGAPDADLEDQDQGEEQVAQGGGAGDPERPDALGGAGPQGGEAAGEEVPPGMEGEGDPAQLAPDEELAAEGKQVTVGGYRVEWPDLTSMSAQEKAAVFQQRVAGYTAAIQGNLSQLMPPLAIMTELDGMSEDKALALLTDAEADQLEQEAADGLAAQEQAAMNPPMPPMGPDGQPLPPGQGPPQGPGQPPSGPPNGAPKPGGPPQFGGKPKPPGAVGQFRRGQPPVGNANLEGCNQHTGPNCAGDGPGSARAKSEARRMYKGAYVDKAMIADMAKYPDDSSTPVKPKEVLAYLRKYLNARGLDLKERTGTTTVRSNRGGGQLGNASGWNVVELATTNRSLDAILNAGDNCGTGAGGFQEGNTCGKGEGSSETREQRLIRKQNQRRDSRSAFKDAFGESAQVDGDSMEAESGGRTVYADFVSGTKSEDPYVELDFVQGRLPEGVKQSSKQVGGTGWSTVAQDLQEGTLDLAHQMKEFLGKLHTLGVGVSFSAEPRRAKLYAKMLARIGYRQVGKDKSGNEVWRPAKDTPTTNEAGQLEALVALLVWNAGGDNCGTGAGGFQPGNTCGKGGGSGKWSYGDALPDHDSWKDLPAEEGYVYHATNLDNAENIQQASLRPHKPWHGTDQDAWPDGSKASRSYFTDKPSTAWMFAPAFGRPVLLRINRSRQFKKESGTGDLYLEKLNVPPHRIEVYTKDGWKPMVERTTTNAGGDNCGIGGEGFESGNECAKGDGGSGLDKAEQKAQAASKAKEEADKLQRGPVDPVAEEYAEAGKEALQIAKDIALAAPRFAGQVAQEFKIRVLDNEVKRAFRAIGPDQYEDAKGIAWGLFSRMTLGAGPLAVGAVRFGIKYGPPAFRMFAQAAEGLGKAAGWATKKAVKGVKQAAADATGGYSASGTPMAPAVNYGELSLEQLLANFEEQDDEATQRPGEADAAQATGGRAGGAAGEPAASSADDVQRDDAAGVEELRGEAAGAEEGDAEAGAQPDDGGAASKGAAVERQLMRLIAAFDRMEKNPQEAKDFLKIAAKVARIMAAAEGDVELSEEVPEEEETGWTDEEGNPIQESQEQAGMDGTGPQPQEAGSPVVGEGADQPHVPLEDVIGAEEGLAANVANAEGCGTGAGGFQQGNTCAKGGEGSGIASGPLKGAKLTQMGRKAHVHLAENGGKHVVKQARNVRGSLAANQDLENEVTVSKMAKVAGVSVPDAQLTEMDGKNAVATKFVEGKTLLDADVKSIPKSQVDRQLAFDILTGARDRHEGQYLWDGKQLHAIDNELTFTPSGRGMGAALRDNVLARQSGPAHKIDPVIMKEMASKAKELAALAPESARKDIIHRGKLLEQAAKSGMSLNQLGVHMSKERGVLDKLLGNANPEGCNQHTGPNCAGGGLAALEAVPRVSRTGKPREDGEYIVNPLPRSKHEDAMEVALAEEFKQAGMGGTEFTKEFATEETVPVSLLESGQTIIKVDKAKDFVGSGYSDPPVVVQYGGRYIVRDGNHRIVSDLLKGKDKVKVRLLYVPGG